jgi:AcrR family transcriptional regulator
MEAMPKITDAQRESRRQQILAAALRCFSRDGFHNTTTADIVRESGVSQGTLYLYFKTKDEIIAALSDDRHQGEAYLNALAQCEPDPVEGLGLLLELYGSSLEDPARNDMRRVSIQGWAEALRDPAIRARSTKNMTAVRQAIVRLIERGQKSGQIGKDVSPDAVARVLIAVFQGLTLQASFGEPIELDGIGRLLTTMLRGALSNDTPQFSPS